MDNVIASQKGSKTFEDAWEDYCQKNLLAFFDDPVLTSANMFIPVGYIRDPFRMFSQATFKDLYDKLGDMPGSSGVELVTILASKRGNTHKRIAIKLCLHIPDNVRNKPTKDLVSRSNNFVYKRSGPRILITRFTANFTDMSKLKKQIKMLLEETQKQRKFMLAASYRQTKEEESTKT